MDLSDLDGFDFREVEPPAKKHTFAGNDGWRVIEYPEASDKWRYQAFIADCDALGYGATPSEAMQNWVAEAERVIAVLQKQIEAVRDAQ